MFPLLSLFQCCLKKKIIELDSRMTRKRRFVSNSIDFTEGKWWKSSLKGDSGMIF